MHFAREEATNNTTEYEGLLAGLRIATELGIKKLIIRGDSQLVVRQVNKDYQSPLMEAYVEEVRRLEEYFDGLQIEHVPRVENSIADHLSKSVAQKLPTQRGTFVLHLTHTSVSPATMAQKRRKLDSGKPLPVESSAPGRDHVATQLLTACRTTPSSRAYGRREQGWCSRSRGGDASSRCRASGSHLGKAHRPLPPNWRTPGRPR